MDRIYLDQSGHVWYATLHENGQNSNQRVFSDDGEEKRFLEYLGESPSNFSIHTLRQQYDEYRRLSRR